MNKVDNDILEKLDQILQERKNASPDSSYVAGLYHKGINSILKKVGEEASETIIASKDGKKQEIIYETADLWFHTMVMLSHHNISSQEVLTELARRFGLSGLEEKEQRKK